jgi:hypothetical protein
MFDAILPGQRGRIDDTCSLDSPHRSKSLMLIMGSDGFCSTDLGSPVLDFPQNLILFLNGGQQGPLALNSFWFPVQILTELQNKGKTVPLFVAGRDSRSYYDARVLSHGPWISFNAWTSAPRSFRRYSLFTC